MRNHSRFLAHAAVLAALYAVLTHFQNILLPGSATWAIQMRLSEALCVLAFFTPAAAMGLAVGCLVFNLTYSAALPLDWLVGSLATYLAAWSMHRLRNRPFVGMLMPALFNAILVGWELTVYIGGGFWLNALFVAIGEAAVLLSLLSVTPMTSSQAELRSLQRLPERPSRVLAFCPVVSRRLSPSL